MKTVEIVLVSALFVLGLFQFIYGVYFVIIALFTCRKQRHSPESEPKKRIKVLIAARNEAEVISNLLRSIFQQEYPKELYDVCVIANNCTDNTAELSRELGAEVYECKRSIHSKGMALDEYFDLSAQYDKYDAFCIFDADNILDPKYLSKINNALCAGAVFVQGRRESKNPYDSYMSSCYTIYYKIYNRFFNRARKSIGLSAIISGSGYVVSTEYLREHGYHTITITEDVETSILAILSGNKVVYEEHALFYDEQPTTLKVSWKQRKRWATGQIQCMTNYSGKLLRYSCKKGYDCSAVDMAWFLFIPVVQFFLVLTLIVGIVYTIVAYNILNLILLLGSVVITILACTIIPLLSICRDGSGMTIKKLWKGVLTFWLFCIEWVLLFIRCSFVKQTKWDEIKHNSNTFKVSDVIESKDIDTIDIQNTIVASATPENSGLDDACTESVKLLPTSDNS